MSQKAAIGPQKEPSRGWDPRLTRVLVLAYTDKSGSSGPRGTKEDTEPLQAGKMFPKQQDSLAPLATCVPRPPQSCFPLSSPCSVAQGADPTGQDQRGPVCFLLASPRGNWLCGSLPGAPGTGCGVSRCLKKVLSIDSLFSILITAPFPCPFGPRGGNSSTVIPQWVSLHPAHIFANTVSPLHTNLQVVNFQRCERASGSSKEPEPLPSMSGVSDTAACPPSPIADNPSAVPSPTSSPSSSQ